MSFSTFPSVLLITTLFRLALSISTSRLILVDADAGKIITTFGQFVIGDSLAVGFVIFSIVTVVQFMLIIPLPTYLVDFLIGLNIVLAILVFMGSFYIERILSFSTFPSVLLITTLFRLALSISTSRLI
ncbi:hypothetical protein CSW74_27590, partial [Shigella sonnei]